MIGLHTCLCPPPKQGEPARGPSTFPWAHRCAWGPGDFPGLVRPAHFILWRVCIGTPALVYKPRGVCFNWRGGTNFNKRHCNTLSQTKVATGNGSPNKHKFFFPEKRHKILHTKKIQKFTCLVFSLEQGHLEHFFFHMSALQCRPFELLLGWVWNWGDPAFQPVFAYYQFSIATFMSLYGSLNLEPPLLLLACYQIKWAPWRTQFFLSSKAAVPHITLLRWVLW